MTISNVQTPFLLWWNNVLNAIIYNPFKNAFAVLIITIFVIISAVIIFLANYFICFRKAKLEKTKRKILALSLAIFTAPYLLYLPTEWFITK